MNIYYVSANGCDTADGLSPETAWKTIQKVNSSVAGGDEVRFRCGDTFYGTINPPAGISAEQPTTYTSYGEGKKPVVCQYKITKPGAWDKISENIFKIDMSDTSRFDGNISELDNNAGFMKIDGRIYYERVYAMDDLKHQWQFFSNYDDNCIYVYSEKCPCEMAKEIKIACNIRCMAFTTHLKVCGIEFRGTGGHGLNGVTRGAYVYDCEFHELGGSHLKGFPRANTRYGNGVECWANSCEVTVDHCKFSGIYDVAITMQGGNVQIDWENMYFTNNEMWDCTQCFEIWASGDIPGKGFKNCHFENNVCVNSGWCWGYEARPDKVNVSHLLIYGLSIPDQLCDITITGNFFSNARRSTIFKAGGAAKMPSGYKIFGNTIIRPKGQVIINVDEQTWDSSENSAQQDLRNKAREVYEAFEKMIVDNNCVIDTISYQN